jgi:hypothetical protein
VLTTTLLKRWQLPEEMARPLGAGGSIQLRQCQVVVVRPGRGADPAGGQVIKIIKAITHTVDNLTPRRGVRLSRLSPAELIT